MTGPSTGIGYELAKICARNGYDLVVCADDSKLQTAIASITPAGWAAEMHRKQAAPGTAS